MYNGERKSKVNKNTIETQESNVTGEFLQKCKEQTPNLNCNKIIQNHFERIHVNVFGADYRAKSMFEV